MVYNTDDAQLLGLWTAIRFLGEVREVEDPIAHDELLMRTQLLFPPRDRVCSARLGVRFDEARTAIKGRTN